MAVASKCKHATYGNWSLCFVRIFGIEVTSQHMIRLFFQIITSREENTPNWPAHFRFDCALQSDFQSYRLSNL